MGDDVVQWKGGQVPCMPCTFRMVFLFSDRRSFPTKHDLDILRLLRWFFTLLETANHHVSPPFGRNIFWIFSKHQTRISKMDHFLTHHFFCRDFRGQVPVGPQVDWRAQDVSWISLWRGLQSQFSLFLAEDTGDLFLGRVARNNVKPYLNIYNVFPKKGIIMDYLYFHNPFLVKHFKIRKLRTTVFFWSKSFNMKPTHASPYLKVLQFLKALNIWVIYNPYKFSFFCFHGNSSQLKMVNDGRTENRASIEIIGDDGTRPQGREIPWEFQDFQGFTVPKNPGMS